MKEKTKAMVMASFAADALALGAHWIYDTTVIEKTFGRVADFQAPGENSFHAGKAKGDFTHYGDQTLALLSSVSLRNGFSLDGFAEDWQALFVGYTGYRDHATRQTLENFQSGQGPAVAGSPSTDSTGRPLTGGSVPALRVCPGTALPPLPVLARCATLLRPFRR